MEFAIILIMQNLKLLVYFNLKQINKILMIREVLKSNFFIHKSLLGKKYLMDKRNTVMENLIK